MQKKGRNRKGRSPLPRKSSLKLIESTLQSLRWKFERLATKAALWWREAHGRRIKSGSVKEAIRAYRQNVLHPPSWLTDYIQRRGYQTA